MFDVGFWELLLLFIIGLMVLGPERLPRVARSLGNWVGQARGYMRQMSDELEREVQRGEIRQQIEASRKILDEGVKVVAEDDGQAPPKAGA